MNGLQDLQLPADPNVVVLLGWIALPPLTSTASIAGSCTLLLPWYISTILMGGATLITRSLLLLVAGYTCRSATCQAHPVLAQRLLSCLNGQPTKG
jgi:hypothetical protein